jgi:hypothetical protein
MDTLVAAIVLMAGHNLMSVFQTNPETKGLRLEHFPTYAMFL